MRQKILITGALGYVGTEICDLLQIFHKHFDIVAVDSNFVPDTVESLKRNNIEFYQRDIFNIRDLLKDADFCIHLAGITDVPQTVAQSTKEKDDLIWKVGVLGTREIIEYSPANCKIFFPSTHVIFEGLKEETHDIDENFPPCPVLAYAKAKYQSELDFLSSNKNFIIGRFGSVYGYNQNMRHKIVANLFAMKAALEGKLNVFGDGSNYKPLVGITDVARCIIFLLGNNYNREIFNIVNENFKISDIANISAKHKKIEICYTNDEIINKGYTLSNKKLILTGFRFLQTLNRETEIMINRFSGKSI